MVLSSKKRGIRNNRVWIGGVRLDRELANPELGLSVLDSDFSTGLKSVFVIIFTLLIVTKESQISRTWCALVKFWTCLDLWELDKHVNGHPGSGESCFPETVCVAWGGAQLTLRAAGKTELTVSYGAVIRVFVIPPNSKREKKNCEKIFPRC